jgi:hypothetical protein
VYTLFVLLFDDLDTQHNNNTIIKIKQCRSNTKTNSEYTNLKVYYSNVMIWIHYITTIDHHFTVIYLQTCVLCVCLVITSTLFYLYMCTVVMYNSTSVKIKQCRRNNKKNTEYTNLKVYYSKVMI